MKGTFLFYCNIFANPFPVELYSEVGPLPAHESDPGSLVNSSISEALLPAASFSKIFSRDAETPEIATLPSGSSPLLKSTHQAEFSSHANNDSDLPDGEFSFLRPRDRSDGTIVSDQPALVLQEDVPLEINRTTEEVTHLDAEAVSLSDVDSFISTSNGPTEREILHEVTDLKSSVTGYSDLTNGTPSMTLSSAESISSSDSFASASPVVAVHTSSPVNLRSPKLEATSLEAIPQSPIESLSSSDSFESASPGVVLQSEESEEASFSSSDTPQNASSFTFDESSEITAATTLMPSKRDQSPSDLVTSAAGGHTLESPIPALTKSLTAPEAVSEFPIEPPFTAVSSSPVSDNTPFTDATPDFRLENSAIKADGVSVAESLRFAPSSPTFEFAPPETPKVQVSRVLDEELDAIPASPDNTAAVSLVNVLMTPLVTSTSVASDIPLSNTVERSLENDWFTRPTADASPISSASPASPDAPSPRSPIASFSFPLAKDVPTLTGTSIPIIAPATTKDLPSVPLSSSLKLEPEHPIKKTVDNLKLPLPRDRIAPGPLTPSVTLKPIAAKENTEPVKEEDVVFAVCVVGFHHSRYVFLLLLFECFANFSSGPEVEYWRGPNGDLSKLWPNLPFQSLPDGSHSVSTHVFLSGHLSLTPI